MITDRRAMVWGVLFVALTLLVSAQASGGSLAAKGSNLQGERIVCPGEEVVPAEVAALAQAVMAVPFPMTETFEGDWPGPWVLRDNSTTDGGEFLMGKRNCHPHGGSNAGWSVGGGAQGTALTCDGTYPNNAKSWAIYGPFSLVGVSSARLTFYLYGQAEGGDQCPYDYLFVGSSIDGNQFQGYRYCSNWTGGTDGNGYFWRTLDLSNRLGQAQVWIAFAFISDGTYAYNGFHVDDITVQTSGGPGGTATVTPTPTRTASATSTLTPTTTPGPSNTVTTAMTARGKVALPLVLRDVPSPTATPTPTATLSAQLSITCLHYGGRQEYVCITNSGGASQSMTNWRIQSVVGNQWYTFPAGYVLAVGATVYVNSGPDAQHNPPTDLRWTTGYIWNDDGDEARLYDSGGQLVDNWAY